MELINLIENEILEEANSFFNLNVPLSDGKAISLIEASGIIKAKIYMTEYIYYQAYIPNTLITKIKQYII